VRYCGVDGEGQGRINHRYVLLAASDESGKMQRYVENTSGLDTETCLEFFLSLPHDCKLFGFYLNYDLTKILADLDNQRLFRLFRPEIRQRPASSKVRAPYAITWEKYRLNLQGTKFSVERGNKKKIIWDVGKFYQSSFVVALKDWKIGDPDVVKQIEYMKKQRSDFDRLDMKDVRKYCFDECQLLGQLVHKLVDAHTSVKLELKNFYGAGSTGGAMLQMMNIKDKKRDPIDEMKEPVAMAFFGGRFEHSVIGPIDGPIYSYDISSAYPYQIYFLPCLEHGRWEWTGQRHRLEKARHALVKYTLSDSDKRYPWSPFPYRLRDGTIIFPRCSGGGWIWRDEYIQGEKLFHNVVFKGAWVLEGDCQCRPFRRIPLFYRERLRIGKEGPGIVLKLGCNSCYGKLAQSIGVPPFQCWIWAGMITSGCRAQLLEMLGLHKNMSNLLAVATDGMYTREEIKPPLPSNTDTFDAVNERGELAMKPLGGWEKKIIPKGVFFARPGIYFPLSPTEEELKSVRARGIGRAAMFESWQRMIDGWENNQEIIDLGKSKCKACNGKGCRYCQGTGQVDVITRFHGAKSCISVRNVGTKEEEYRRSPSYGQWEPRPIQMSLNPLPKREGIKRVGDYGILGIRTAPLDVMSQPYSNSMISPETIKMLFAEQEAIEQPDGGELSEYPDRQT
jgi:hypothetical protein